MCAEDVITGGGPGGGCCPCFLMPCYCCFVRACWSLRVQACAGATGEEMAREGLDRPKLDVVVSGGGGRRRIEDCVRVPLCA